jgi:hypothetical protein
MSALTGEMALVNEKFPLLLKLPLVNTVQFVKGNNRLVDTST